MKLKDRVIVVTGGANGIGRALCYRFAAEGARGVVVADVEAGVAEQVAREIGGLAVATDVRRETDIDRLVARATAAYGPIDLFCSNAGIFVSGGVETSGDDWQRIWEINVRAHIYAARAVLPGNAGAWRGIPAANGLGRRLADSDWLCALRRDQARGGRAGGVAVDDAW